MKMTNTLAVAVSDEEFTLNRIRDDFTSEGYEVVTASSAPSALALLINRAPAVVVLDMAMPRSEVRQICDAASRCSNATVVLAVPYWHSQN